MKRNITCYTAGMFMAVWLGYYNVFAFPGHRLAGGAVSIAAYCLVYSRLARLYRAFEVDICQTGEIIFSQALTAGMADTFAYLECCLAAGRYVGILPGLFTFVFQIMGISVWAVAARRYFLSHTEAEETLVIYGAEDVGEFCGKLHAGQGHLFHVAECVPSCAGREALHEKIKKYGTVVLYEVEYGTRTETVEYCIRLGKELYMTPRVSDIIIQGFENRPLVDTPLVRYGYGYRGEQGQAWKRRLDVAGALVMLGVFAVPMAVTALLIKLEDGGPVFYKQKRCTKDGKVFEILKFRSMIKDAEKGGAVIPCVAGDARVTKVGHVIRRLRIDETPQVFNILKGEMSLVGPRPERVEHVEEYTREMPEFVYRQRVKSGLTGYAQIYGKYNTGARDKLKLDLMYIENESLVLDLKLIMMTVKTVFMPESTEGFAEEKSRAIGKWKDGEGTADAGKEKAV